MIKSFQLVLSKKQLLVLLLLYMSMIFVLSHIPSGTDNELDYIHFKWLTPAIGNFLHIPLYAGLAYLWVKYFLCAGYDNGGAKTGALIVSMLYGVSDEIHQYFIPGRFASFSDLVLNTVGIFLILKYYPVVDRLFRIKLQQEASETV